MTCVTPRRRTLATASDYVINCDIPEVDGSCAKLLGMYAVMEPAPDG